MAECENEKIKPPPMTLKSRAIQVLDQISSPVHSWPHHVPSDDDAEFTTKKTGLQVAVAIAMPSPHRSRRAELNHRQGDDYNERLEYAIGLYHCPWRDTD